MTGILQFIFNLYITTAIASVAQHLHEIRPGPEVDKVNEEANGGSTQFRSDKNETREEVCLTKGCEEIAQFILENIDETVDPCDDFYDFACGQYMKRTVIPDDKPSAATYLDIDENLLERNRLLLEQESPVNATKITIMTKQFYNSCMNEEHIDKLGLEPLLDILNKLGGWPVIAQDSWDEANFSVFETLYKIDSLGLPIDSLLSFEVRQDYKNSSRRVIELDQADLGLEREYLIKGVKDSDVQAYLKYSTSAAVLLGADPETAERDMTDALLFEIQLANISSRREDRRNNTKLYNIRSLKELEEMAPIFPWLNFLNKLLPSSVEIGMDEKIIVRETYFLKNLNDLIRLTNKRTMANYLLWRVIKETATYSSDKIRELEFELTSKLKGQTKQIPRWKECIRLIQRKLPYGLSQMYVKKYFSQEEKTQVQVLDQYLRNSFDEILKTIDWMDEATRAKALEKSKAILSHIGYPEELLQDSVLEDYYKGVDIDENSFLNNILMIQNFTQKSDRAQLREQFNRLDWKLPASETTEVAAYVKCQEVSMTFTAGILSGIYFNPQFPKYVNFASIGHVIGHEITHNFDDRGKQLDYKGNLENWWQPEAEENYSKKAKCTVNQYNNYILPENGLQLNGVNSLGENIADNGGAKESYRAYQQWVKDNGKEAPLPGLSYNVNQLFWITVAQKYCEKSRSEHLRHQVMTGEHSPKRFRVVEPLSNSEDFANDFKCSLGSKMNSGKRCGVW